MRPLSQRIENASLIIADSGIHGSTREAVGGLRRRYENDPDNIGPRINRLGALTQNAIMALDQADAPALGVAMDEAHAVLTELSLSLPILDDLTEAARSAGALGAKLTGGGLGGCTIALADGPRTADRIRAELERAGAAATWTYRMRVSEADG